MNIIIIIISIIFILIAAAVMFACYRTRHAGLFWIGFTYGASGVVALMLMQAWPLAAGFSMVWVMKMMGMDSEVKEEKKSGDS